MDENKKSEFDIVILKFADSEIPEFKEVKNKDYILFGKDNNYPEYLTYLYNKSSRHNAIINGKTNYICGSCINRRSKQPYGWAEIEIKNQDGSKTIIPAKPVNKKGETIFDILKKSVKDIEIYGGFRWSIIKDRLGRIAEIYHVDFYKFRKAKNDSGYFYKEDWSKFNKDEAIYYNEFDPNFFEYRAQIFAYDEYRPGCDYYPLPGYIGANNYIDTDIEISKFHLSSIKNGMMPSKMIQFYTGEPDESKKKAIEKRFQQKFGGSENAGRIILVFNNSKEKSVDVNDLSGSELDKQFDLLNRTCEQHIITGHQIVSGMLFGIKTEGQLGGTQELKTAYELFINTYAKPKQADLIKIINYFGDLMGMGCDYEIKQLEPVGIVVTDDMLKGVLQPDEIRELSGLPKIDKPQDDSTTKILNILSTVSPLIATKILDSLSPNEIRALAGAAPVQGGNAILEPTKDAPIPGSNAPILPPLQDGQGSQINSHLKNLTGSQQINLDRIVRKYKKGVYTLDQAILMLTAAFGFDDEEAKIMLGIVENNPTIPTATEPIQQSTQQYKQQFTEDEVVHMFNSCGDLKNDFHIITSKRKQKFNQQSAADYEATFYTNLMFATEVTNAEANIIDLIRKDNKITPEVIAETLGTTEEYVTSKIASLVKRGVLSQSEDYIGDDVEVTRTIKEKVKSPDKPETTQVFIKYSYEPIPGQKPIIPTTRPFCRKLIQLDRLYSRAEIESISQRLGYSVWDRRGGWWGDSPTCRHIWVSHIVVKKGKK